MRIITTLGEIRRGAFVADLDAEFRSMVDAVRDTGGTGEITVKFVFKPMQGDELGIEMKDEIKPKAPRRQTGKTIFFATEDGGLARSDPRQPELPMQVVAKTGKAG